MNWSYHMKKMDLEKRYTEAKNQKNLTKIPQEKLLSILEKCLTEGNIDGNISIIKPDEFKNLTIQRINNRWASCLFILFTENGHVAVVGAGADISFSYKTSTGIILKHINEKWDDQKLILITFKNLKAVGLKDCTNVLECRNGIENYIGEYLSKQGVPILNYYQHWNYKKDIWKKWEENNYIL